MQKYVYILIAFLISLYVYNVWNIGIMHTDDAIWFLQWYQAKVNPIWEWATSQGRFYALVTGEFLLHGNIWQGTLYGELLKIIPFVSFSLLLAYVLSIYFTWQVAALSISFFYGLSSIRFDGSVLFTYPLLIWPFACSLLGSIIFAHLYSFKNKNLYLLASGILFFLSLFTNEAMTATFILIYFFSWLANIFQKLDSNQKSLELIFKFKGLVSKHDLRVFIVFFTTIFLYAFLSLGFKYFYPSQYSGHSFASFDLDNFLYTLSSFALNGSIFSILYKPFSIIYADYITGSGTKVIYSIAEAHKSILESPIPFITGLIEGVALYLIFKSLLNKVIEPVSENNNSLKFKQKLHPILIIVPGLVFLFIPVLPVALTSKYQDWHLNLGVQAYVSTIICHFGLSMVVAGLAVLLLKMLSAKYNNIRVILCSIIILTVVYFSVLNYLLNQQIVWNMRPEGIRWKVIEEAHSFLIKHADASGLILIPQFKYGSWFTVVSDSYWSDLTEAKFKKRINIAYKLPEKNVDLKQDISLLSYVLTDDHRSFSLILSKLEFEGSSKGSSEGSSKGSSEGAIIKRITIKLADSSSSNSSMAVLHYYDKLQGPKQISIKSLESKEQDGLFILDNLRAEPGTILLTFQSQPGPIDLKPKVH